MLCGGISGKSSEAPCNMLQGIDHDSIRVKQFHATCNTQHFQHTGCNSVACSKLHVTSCIVYSRLKTLAFKKRSAVYHYYTTIIPLLYYYYTTIIPLLYHYYIPLLYHYYTTIRPLLYHYYTTIIPLLYTRSYQKTELEKLEQCMLMDRMFTERVESSREH